MNINSYPPELIYTIGEIYEAFLNPELNHAYRYKKLVDISTNGYDCKYAKASYHRWLSSGQSAETINTLLSVQEQITRALQLYQEIEKDLNESTEETT